MKNSLQKIILASVLSLSAHSVFAHGAWLAERLGSPTVIYGHAAHEDAYNPKKITWVGGYSNHNQPLAVEKNDRKNNTVLKPANNVAYIGFVFDNGYWSKSSRGKWENLPKNEVEGAKQGGRYLKYALAVLQDNVQVKPINQLVLQIIPLANPLKKKAGDTLDILVLHQGKPLANAKVIRDYANMSHENNLTTNQEGKASLVIRNQGLNVIAVSYSEALKDDPKADKNGYVSTLSFTLEHLDED